MEAELSRRHLRFTFSQTSTFNNANQLTQSNTFSSGRGVSGGIASYSYDGAGNRTSQSVAGVGTSFSYNPSGQATQVSRDGRQTSYAYDGLGRQASSTNQTEYGMESSASRAMLSVLPKDGEQMSEDWELCELLPGRTVKQWSRVGLFGIAMLAVGMLGAATCALIIVSRTKQWDPLTLGFLVVLVVGFAWVWFCYLAGNRKEERELEAGYTTAAQGNNEVARVHSPTGVVMRRAGEPDLSRQDWERAMEKVRAFQRAKLEGRED
ncbi:hypothetical protein ACFVU2_09870 [Leifsonia sp. NPDC058194]|uniref:hypothetical protein n=1 Tax=Leifsonia sp. NPDC058194 TaxID=3346374 RepID=UPI0036DC7AFE